MIKNKTATPGVTEGKKYAYFHLAQLIPIARILWEPFGIVLRTIKSFWTIWNDRMLKEIIFDVPLSK